MPLLWLRTDYKLTVSDCFGEPVVGICCIKVLGSGCKACHQLYDYTLKAVEGMASRPIMSPTYRRS